MGHVSCVRDPGFFITYSVVSTLGLILLIRLADPFEREPLGVVALMTLWGGTAAVGIGLAGNHAIATLLPARTDEVFGAALTAPLVEEFGKGLALVMAFAVSRAAARRFGTIGLDGVTDGIVYGAAVGIGFAFTENIFYFMQSLAGRGGLREAMDVFTARAGFLGLGAVGHAMYTATFGAGLGLATWSWRRRHKIGLPAAGFFVAVLMHACYNGLAQLVLSLRYGFSTVAVYYTCLAQPGCVLSGPEKEVGGAAPGALRIADAVDKAFLIAFVVGVVLWIRYQRRVIREELTETAEAGLIPLKEAEILTTYGRRTRWYLHVLRRGKVEHWRILRSMHALMIDLALTKHRLRRTGPEGRWQRVDDLWRRIRALRRAAVTP